MSAVPVSLTPKWYTVAQVAKLLGYGESKVRMLIMWTKFRQLRSHRDKPPCQGSSRPRPHPMTGPHLVGGTGVRGERSESRSDGAAALDGRDGDQTLQAG
jgi:hypothetical protein